MSSLSSTTESKINSPEHRHANNSSTTAKNIPLSTKFGYVLVTQQGPADRTVIVTFHDIAFNSATQFHDFFSSPEMLSVTEHFTIYHINAPGQEDTSHPLPTAYTYPTFDQLAEMVSDVFDQLNIKSAIGFGIGAGANILLRFALRYQTKICGLVLVNCITRSAKWHEGLSLKWPKRDIQEQRWSDSILKYLMWYHLGSENVSSQSELSYTLRRHLEEDVKVTNVIKFLNAYFKRTAIHLERPNTSNKSTPDPSKILQCNAINVTGVASPHKDDVIETNDRLNPAMTSFVEFTDCGGAILDEQPARMAEAIRLFLQGLGYMSHLSIPRYSTASRLAEQEAEYKRQHGPLSKVPFYLKSQIDFDKDELVHL